MSYDSVILLTDVGIIGSITAVIVTLAVVLGRKEDQRKERAVPVPLTLRQLVEIRREEQSCLQK